MGILTFIIVLAVLIFVHEFGHFYFAKRAGVGVEKFSIGFGPKIIGFKRGETEYVISLIPLGGFVKMTGDNPDEAQTGSDKEYLSRPIRDRLPIVAAGPIVNLVVAFLIMPVVYMLGVQVPAFISKPVQVGYVATDSPAQKAGIQAGDQIVSINGKDTKTWEDLLTATMAEPEKKIDVGLVRGGTKMSIPVKLGTDENGASLFGVQPDAPTLVGKVSPGSAAEAAGIKEGDRIVSINGTPVNHWVVMADLVQKIGAQPIQVSLERNGQPVNIQLTPRMDDESKRVIMGIQRDEPLELQKYGFFPAIREGFGRSVQMLGQTFAILGKLFTGQLSMKSLGGPIRIAQATSAAAESGLSDVLSLMAFLSLQLGIMNLLPFPVLDGGHIFFMGIEAIRRRPISRKALEISNQVGFVLLITLMVVVTKNDIMHAWGSNLRALFEGVKHLF
jgi:regulator of sigma E protease